MIRLCPLYILSFNKRCSTCIFYNLLKKNKCGYDEYEPIIKKDKITEQYQKNWTNNLVKEILQRKDS